MRLKKRTVATGRKGTQNSGGKCGRRETMARVQSKKKARRKSKRIEEITNKGCCKLKGTGL